MTCHVNGIGMVRYTMVVNLLMLWAVRIPVAYLISRYFDSTWVMAGIPISFCFGLLCMVGFYLLSPAWKSILQKPMTDKTNVYHRSKRRNAV